MILRIGRNNFSERGFTLVEVILSLAIVTAGLVFILEALSKEINAVSISADKIETTLFLSQKASEVVKELLTKKEITPVSQRGEIIRGARLYKWTLDINENKFHKNLYDIRLGCLWNKLGGERQSVLETRFYKRLHTR